MKMKENRIVIFVAAKETMIHFLGIFKNFFSHP
jgi:hypothetical protein